MICAPLKDADGNAFGALQIDSTQGGGQFMEEDTDLLSGVAAQAGIVINNARMHEEALKQKEVQQDSKLATEVQQAFLPDSEPVGTGYRVSSFYQAANHIGGDYFDYVEMADGRIGVVVADVVGRCRSDVHGQIVSGNRVCLAREPDVAKAIEQLNDRMSRLQVGVSSPFSSWSSILHLITSRLSMRTYFIIRSMRMARSANQVGRIRFANRN